MFADRNKEKDSDHNHKVGIISLKSVTTESKKMSSESYLTSVSNTLLGSFCHSL